MADFALRIRTFRMRWRINKHRKTIFSAFFSASQFVTIRTLTDKREKNKRWKCRKRNSGCPNMWRHTRDKLKQKRQLNDFFFSFFFFLLSRVYLLCIFSFHLCDDDDDNMSDESSSLEERRTKGTIRNFVDKLWIHVEIYQKRNHHFCSHR